MTGIGNWRRRAAGSPGGHGHIRIGISGWRYDGWRGSFYPPGLRQTDELAYAGRHFDTIEINGTHYSLQRPDSFARWHDETPDRFVFAIKGSRFITHMKKQLREIEAPLANFFAQGLLRLGGKLGPLLWQFPPRFRGDPEHLEPFLRLLPRTNVEAAALAEQHDHRLAGRAWTKAVGPSRPLRHAIEIRHPACLDRDFIALLRRYEVALVFSDGVNFPYAEDVTADFLYLRLHGSEELYASGYSGEALDRWAARLLAWSAGGQPPDARLIDPGAAPRRVPREIYLYFDNDAKVRAPFDAQALCRRLPGHDAAANSPPRPDLSGSADRADRSAAAPCER